MNQGDIIDLTFDEDVAPEPKRRKINETVGEELVKVFWLNAIPTQTQICLIGKTFDKCKNKHVSCSVVVNNIQRKIYFQMRDRKFNKPEKTTFEGCQDEIVAALLAHIPSIDLNQVKFELKKKTYIFDNITRNLNNSFYVEVRYPVLFPKLPSHLIGDSFSRIFGVDTPIQELLFVDRKIKGPCWIEIGSSVQTSDKLSRCDIEINCDAKYLTAISGEMPPLIVAAINIQYKHAITSLACITYSYDSTQPENIKLQKQFGFSTNYCDNTRNVYKVNNENVLIKHFWAKWRELDVDLVIGYNLHGSKLKFLDERLKDLPNIKNDLFNGKIVCDIKIIIKDLIALRSDDFSTICKTVLKIDTIKSFLDETEYYYKIVIELNIILFAIEMCRLTGCLMSTLFVGRQMTKIESILVHHFNEQNYIVPDKFVMYNQSEEKHKGGLVLTPHVNVYHTYVILFDFNSIYPSIIRENNICLTTVPADLADFTNFKPFHEMGVLPHLLETLINRRKRFLQIAIHPLQRNPLKYEIQAKALKIVANAVYGCLANQHFRFYAPNIAELVTFKGRELLRSTRDLIEAQYRQFDVIYGDTDSIMVNTQLLDYESVVNVADEIKRSINLKYKSIEIGIEAIYKSTILYAKKKYAAFVVRKNTSTNELSAELEIKGLDIIRRDYPIFTSNIGRFIVEKILNFEFDMQEIMRYLEKSRNDLLLGKVALKDLTVANVLKKAVSEYKNPDYYPHVQVAKRCNNVVGDCVSYIFGLDGTEKGVFTLDEFSTNRHLKVDVDKYLNSYLYTSVIRLCEPIDKNISNIRMAILNESEDKKKASVVNDSFKGLILDKVCFFSFKCPECGTLIKVLPSNYYCVLKNCPNQNCNRKPIDYLDSIITCLDRRLHYLTLPPTDYLFHYQHVIYFNKIWDLDECFRFNMDENVQKAYGTLNDYVKKKLKDVKMEFRSF